MIILHFYSIKTPFSQGMVEYEPLNIYSYCNSNENTDKNGQNQLFRTVEINKRFATLHSRKTAKYLYEQWALYDFSLYLMYISFSLFLAPE